MKIFVKPKLPEHGNRNVDIEGLGPNPGMVDELHRTTDAG